MRLLQAEFMVDIGGNNGRYPADAVLIADEETAFRWYERGIAVPADPDDEPYGEIQRRNKREEFKRRAKAIEAGGVFDQAVRRDAFDGNQRQIMPPPMPTPRRRGRSRDDLAGAEVVNAVGDDE